VGNRDGRTQSARVGCCCIWLSGPGFQDLNARFQDLILRTWVSGPQREVSRPGSQDLGFRPSVFGSQHLGFRPSVLGSQDLGFRTSKALHPTVVLSFSRHFSLRPSPLFFFPSLSSTSTVTFLCVQWSQTHARTQQVTLYIRYG
jgi:hypothetical protein